MKNYKKGIIVASMMLATASLSVNVFAENYGIQYSGGQQLSESNITIDPDLIDGLTPLFKSVISSETTYSNSNKWENGYMLITTSNVCKPMKYFRLSGTKTVSSADNLKMTLSNENYSVDISFEEASVEGYVDDGKDFAVAMDGNWIDGMTNVYLDETCETPATDIKTSGYSQGSKIFIKTNITLRAKGYISPFISDEMFLGIIDIDAAQSYKVLNPTNLMVKGNTFARNLDDLHGDNPESPLKNMYVGSGNYIYSQFDLEVSPHAIGSSNKSNIYIQLDRETQEDGVDFVFGFANGAGSRIDYYVQEYLITYESDEGGTITDLTDQVIISGDNPSGTEVETKDGYTFKYWVADKDVTLVDGTTIEAGEPLTMDQIEAVIVHQDIIFTAIHGGEEKEEEKESDVAVPNTGVSTGNIELATIASTSVIGVLTLALFIRALPRLTHKSIKFD